MLETVGDRLDPKMGHVDYRCLVFSQSSFALKVQPTKNEIFTLSFIRSHASRKPTIK